MSSEWINMEDKAPEEGQRVIIFTSDNRGILYDYVFVEDYEGNIGNDFFEAYRDGFQCVRNATHWMPMIQPPTSEIPYHKKGEYYIASKVEWNRSHIEDFILNQKDIDEIAQKVINENFWELTE